MITVPKRYGQTDRRTTYDSNTALCVASRGKNRPIIGPGPHFAADHIGLSAIKFFGGLRKTITIFPQECVSFLFKVIQSLIFVGYESKALMCNFPLFLVRHSSLSCTVHRFVDIVGFCAHVRPHLYSAIRFLFPP